MLQICDFGLAKWKRLAATQTITGKRCGTFAYMAPEVFKDPNVSRTTKYDVFSFGILLWVLLSGQEPYKNGMDTCIVRLLKISLLDLKQKCNDE